tara:strand:+ start:621 stop:884 length:264 start_codon:yes stop_codon:yes gene_type:complete
MSLSNQNPKKQTLENIPNQQFESPTPKPITVLKGIVQPHASFLDTAVAIPPPKTPSVALDDQQALDEEIRSGNSLSGCWLLVASPGP